MINNRRIIYKNNTEKETSVVIKNSIALARGCIIT